MRIRYRDPLEREIRTAFIVHRLEDAMRARGWRWEPGSVRLLWDPFTNDVESFTLQALGSIDAIVVRGVVQV